VSDGKCLCAGVRYRVSGSFGDVRYCHCSRCRRATGTAFSADATLEVAQLEITAGRAAICEYEQSPGAFRAFCGRCGAPIFARRESEPQHVRVRLGGFRGPLDARITAHVWVGSKSSWYEIAGSLPCHAEAIDGPRLPAPPPPRPAESPQGALTAHCLCAGVAIEVAGKVGPVVYCHCSRCRKASGSALGANANVRRRYWRFAAGEDLVREFEGSPGVWRAFCSRCGSPVYSRWDGEPEMLRLRLGLVNEDPGRRSLAHFWVGSKAPWFEISDSLPQFERGPADHESEVAQRLREG
jgi:hypothetical protein